MTPEELLAVEFELHRPRLRAVAYRMLGSLAEADDAVQEAWLRLSRNDSGEIANLAAWLTTVVGRVCLDLLRARTAHREQPLPEHLPDPVVGADDAGDPEHQALLADAVGLALQVVLHSLAPAERLAFVLHDMFGLPFEQIGPLVDRTPGAAKKLASRARRRVRAAPHPGGDPAEHRRAVDAFRNAAAGGDFDALLAILDPDVLLRADTGAHPLQTVRGAATVAGQATGFRRGGGAGATMRPVLINGLPGLAGVRDGRPISLMSFTVAGGRIAGIDILADPDRLGRLDLPGFDDRPDPVTSAGPRSS
ncbi:sigma-70 family RNA polymerase sigma factor [Nocardia aurantia]|uniref:ECF RNA polymerase sigma factor SigJ n=1 Tax=Nocardia aurantia TaxID=2585199 RepID=A0A7K0DY54_9NOCA|nr:sigma-70 family RNA polymerase sigma factor [Nocardia aurantia]MQY30478.1 ECF RNA polymerase sigma factor SigJ [Nocardia aurantia]